MHANAPDERMQGIPDGWTEDDVCEVCHGACCSSTLWLVLAACCLSPRSDDAQFYIYAIPRALLVRTTCKLKTVARHHRLASVHEQPYRQIALKSRLTLATPCRVLL